MDDTNFKYQLFNANHKAKPFAEVWWDGKKLRSDNKSILRSLEEDTIMGKTIEDGLEFFEALPHRYNSGYVFLKKVPKDSKEKSHDEDK